MSQVRYASINIERSKHLDTVIAFLREYQPEVFAVQELFQRDIARLEQELESTCIFAPMGLHPDDDEACTPTQIGVAFFSRLPLIESHVKYYHGGSEEALHGVPMEKLIDRPIVSIQVEKENVPFRFVTTHFTWTPNGMADDTQRRDIVALMALLEAEKEFVFSGDLNAPRGGEIFAKLAEKYKDNIPPQYLTSIDVDLHRAGKTHPEQLADKMVDGLFSTPEYAVSDAALHSGISDHMAITATITHSVY